MPKERQPGLQEIFLNTVRKSKVQVTVYLVSGVKLQGTITWFDSFCLLLRRNGLSQLVYKHAVSTVMPERPLQLHEIDEPDQDPDD